MSPSQLNIAVVFRTKVDNKERLELFKLALQSYKEKKMHKLGPLYVIDDQGSLGSDVMTLTLRHKGNYVRTEGTPSTTNGLYHALKAVKDSPYSLQCVDDIVFATGSREKVEKIVEKEVPLISANWAMVQLFCPHTVEHHFRTPHTLVYETKLHLVDNSSWLFHANVMNLWSQVHANNYINQYQTVIDEYRKNRETIHDDHCQRLIASRNNTPIYLTTTCFAWHTGAKHRSFVDPKAGGASYQAARFSGSAEDKKGK